MNKITAVLSFTCMLACTEPSITSKTPFVKVSHGSCDILYTPGFGNLYKEVFEDGKLIDFTVIVLDGSQDMNEIIKKDSVKGCK
jgi:hypothetical protein